jgi:hypothetical protein
MADDHQPQIYGMGSMRVVAKMSGMLAFAFLAACGEATGPNKEAVATFVVEVSGEEFRVQVTSETQAEAFRARMASGAEGVVSGSLISGSGGINSPWKWHLDAATVHVTDMAIELCDGRPSMVDADLAYWLNNVGQFCPWGAKVVREE